MLRNILLFLAVGLLPSFVWGEASGVGSFEVVGLSSGSYTVAVSSSGRLKVETQDAGSQSTANNQTFFLCAQNIDLSASGGENGMILIVNSSTSTKVATILSNSLTNQDSTAFIQFKFYYGALITSSGTVAEIHNANIGGTGTSSLQAYINPTFSNTGTCIDTNVLAARSSIIRPVNGLFLLQPGQTILITGNPTLGGADASIRLIWSEQ